MEGGARPGQYWSTRGRPSRALSSGEIDVLEWVRAGLTIPEIGAVLHYSPDTIKMRLRAVYQVFGLDFGKRNLLMAALRWEHLRGTYEWRLHELNGVEPGQPPAALRGGDAETDVW